jgi:hypothetical protein
MTNEGRRQGDKCAFESRWKGRELYFQFKSRKVQRLMGLFQPKETWQKNADCYSDYKRIVSVYHHINSRQRKICSSKKQADLNDDHDDDNIHFISLYLQQQRLN